MNRFDRVTIASRAFCIAAIFGLSLLTADAVALQGTIMLAAIAASASWLSLAIQTAGPWVAVAEALLVGLLISLILPSSGGLLLLPYLAVPSLVAGISRGLAGATLVVAAETVSILLMLFPFDVDEIRSRATVAGPWFLTSLGVGLLGAWLRQMGKAPATPHPDSAYESARRLLTQLRTVARRLSAGLDPVSMASQLLTTVHERLDDRRSAVFVRTEGGRLTPLAHRGAPGGPQLSSNDPLVKRCWAEMEAVHAEANSSSEVEVHRCALPLRAGSRMIGVILSDLARSPAEEIIGPLMVEMDEHSLRLDTALTFDEIRTIAAIEERQRLAREIHDGVAQEVASLGYLVDDLTATATDKTQRDKLRELRIEVTKVVSDLRLSIFDLRSGVEVTAGLGAALSDYVRRVGSRSDITVHLTLDEAPDRLRGDVESEVLRIAQEAITNARKHSGAANLWVDCRVHPPFVRLEVRDDGDGLGAGRDDSYGITIMRERAERIAAHLQIDGDASLFERGTRVVVTLGEPPSTSKSNEIKGGGTWQALR